jgi:feruloyl esterase
VLASLAFLPARSFGTCASLTTLQLPNTTITKAEDVTSGKFTPPVGKVLTHLPAFCRVAATLKPSPDSDIRIEIWMPQSGWNERFEGTGNGGFAGTIIYNSLAEGLRAGYAVANTDMGMAAPPGQNASIFVNRPERWADWGYRATHEMTVVAKQIVRAYYERDAKHAYFTGCSTGGEQALMESQRYPDDYDGIVGGAPAHNRTGVHVSVLWNFAADQKSPGAYLHAAALFTLSQAVLKACDLLDGVKDGVVSDPAKCQFDPAVLQCKQANQAGCLSPEQVKTAQAIYAGPKNPRTGESLYPGLPLGSEAGWEGLDRIPSAAAVPPYAPIFQWVFGTDWDWKQFDFDHQDTAFTQKLAGTLNATNPDLDTFRAHGHKLLLYHGWADWLVAPGETIHYYNAVAARAKAEPNGQPIDQSVRLFMVPGMAHCSGGPGATHFDALSPVVDWVEHGVAPEKIIATTVPTTDINGAQTPQRPLCSYPAIAQYKGTGDTNDAANFTCTVK